MTAYITWSSLKTLLERPSTTLLGRWSLKYRWGAFSNIEPVSPSLVKQFLKEMLVGKCPLKGKIRKSYCWPGTPHGHLRRLDTAKSSISSHHYWEPTIDSNCCRTWDSVHYKTDQHSKPEVESVSKLVSTNVAVAFSLQN